MVVLDFILAMTATAIVGFLAVNGHLWGLIGFFLVVGFFRLLSTTQLIETLDDETN